LPDITVYLEALGPRVLGHTLAQCQVASPFLVRSERQPAECAGHAATELRRVGKRIAIGFDNGAWLVFHLMIAGRLHWSVKAKQPDGRRTLAAFLFDSGCLTLTEAGTQKRASLHVVSDPAELDPGGLDVLSTTVEAFTIVLRSANHTLKRSLTDPHLFSGIGNAYSDEILHRARLSPVLLTSRVTDQQAARLFDAVRRTLIEWTDRLRVEAAGAFPEKVTAFRKEMAVHGRYGEPCPTCGTKVQRIRYASNETNYCPTCQTSGKLLADRALSRLLRQDWPRSLDELEQLRRRQPSTIVTDEQP
jgi:formamidopyrimidine-DNA glycosylase